MSCSDAAAWMGALATFLAVLVALFQEDLRSLWNRPNLKATIRLSAPDCHRTEVTVVNQQSGEIVDRWPCYYFRIWVENIGNRRAEQVQVFASQLMRKQEDGSYKEVKHFLPMNLRWSHGGQGLAAPEIFAEGISPTMGKHCDLGHISHPSGAAKTGETLPGVLTDTVIMSLDLEVKPNTRSHLLAPDMYLLELRLAAANSQPVKKVLELSLTGKWYDDEAEMFSDGVSIHERS